MKLSIIITTCNQQFLTDDLVNVLSRQQAPEVEIIVIDDGSKTPYHSEQPGIRIVRKNNGGVSSARNRGIKEAKGEYIAFIDGDDMVSDDYVTRILEEIESNPFDVCDLSWRSLSSIGAQFNHLLRSRSDRLPNPSSSTRVFNRVFIGDVRFNTKKDSTEDEDFTRHLGVLTRTDYRHTAITSYVYFYRTDQTDSKSKKYYKGLCKTRKIVYYYKHVTADMVGLLEEIRKKDDQHEVWLMTEQCDIPELSLYCQIKPPHQTWAHEVYGEPYPIEIVSPPIETQVVIYSKSFNPTGGITSFTYNWCQHMRQYYDITVLYGEMPAEHIAKFSQIVRTVPESDTLISCDTLIINRLNDPIPSNVVYKRTVQMCHACRLKDMDVPQDRDVLVNVSQASKDSWGVDARQGIVINNIPYSAGKRGLFLVSATRIGASDKGDCDIRMRTLAQKLDASGIPWLWINFSSKALDNMPTSFINLPPQLDIQPFIARADYLVQLSDQEAYSMAILEALTNNTAVIATPFPSLTEEGFIDGVHGYCVPYDMGFDINILLNVPQFEFQYDTSARMEQWRDVLGRTTRPRRNYTPPPHVNVRVVQKYHDKVLNTLLYPGEVISVPTDRASYLEARELVTRIM